MNNDYYEIRKTLNKYPFAKYYIVYGERSNGKSYSTLSYFIEEFYNNMLKGKIHSFGYIRRWRDDVVASNMEEVFKNLKSNDNNENEIERVTKGKFNTVLYKNRKFFLQKLDNEGNVIDEVVEPFGYVFSLSDSERKKSTGYPTIKNIVFEEFIAEGLPMVNEFKRFQSVLSTIIRNRDDVKIFMLGNTINKYNIYFNEFGLYKAKNQLKNTVDVYEYVDDDDRVLQVACEYADFPNRKKIKKSNIYFAFNKEKNKMNREGSWDIGSYPHLTHRYKPKDIRLMYFIEFEQELFQCEIIKTLDSKDNLIIDDEDYIVTNKNVYFTYIHRKTSPIKDISKHIIYKQEHDSRNNIRRKINNCYDDIGSFIFSFFISDRVLYQSNDVGNAIDSYLNWCKSNK